MGARELEKDAVKMTAVNKKHADAATKRLLHYYADTSAEDRVTDGECRYCFYLARGVSGRAFTTSNCENCGAGMRFSTTRINKYCEQCGTTYNVCRHCGAVAD